MTPYTTLPSQALLADRVQHGRRWEGAVDSKWRDAQAAALAAQMLSVQASKAAPVAERAA
jgi:hypothetical protein